MADERIRFGILGCARIARKVSRAIGMSSNAALHAIGSRSLEKAKAFASANNVSAEVKLYGSYEMVLDDPFVDAVYIPLPTTLHLEWALKSAHKKKHILLEKPPALCVDDIDKIIEACHTNGVQLMDCTMWLHHPRTAKMKELIENSELFGDLKTIHSTFTLAAGPDFLQSNIRVRPDLDALGALGDVGWYCIRAILWANDYQMPERVIALPGPVFNEIGVIIACGSSFLWKDGRVATYHCSFLSDMSMDLSVHGTRGTLHLNDFVIPYEENSATFTFSSGTEFTEIHTGWEKRPSEHRVAAELPQEVLMLREFARLVKNIRDCGGKPDPHWPSITRKTQMLLNAVKTSIQEGFISICRSLLQQCTTLFPFRKLLNPCCSSTSIESGYLDSCCSGYLSEAFGRWRVGQAFSVSLASTLLVSIHFCWFGTQICGACIAISKCTHSLKISGKCHFFYSDILYQTFKH